MPIQIKITLALWIGINVLFVLWRWFVTRNRQP